MINNTRMARVALFFIAVSLLLPACSDSKIPSASQQIPTKKTTLQTEEERQYILANKNTVNTAAYLFNLAERYEECKKLHSEIEGQSHGNSIKLTKWTAKVEQQFVGEIPQKIVNKLKRITKIQVAELTQSSTPSLTQCKDLHRKIATDDITPGARNLVAKN